MAAHVRSPRLTRRRSRRNGATRSNLSRETALIRSSVLVRARARTAIVIHHRSACRKIRRDRRTQARGFHENVARLRLRRHPFRQSFNTAVDRGRIKIRN